MACKAKDTHICGDYCEQCEQCSETPGRVYNNADITSGQWVECDMCHGRGCVSLIAVVPA